MRNRKNTLSYDCLLKNKKLKKGCYETNIIYMDSTIASVWSRYTTGVSCCRLPQIAKALVYAVVQTHRNALLHPLITVIPKTENEPRCYTYAT